MSYFSNDDIISNKKSALTPAYCTCTYCTSRSSKDCTDVPGEVTPVHAQSSYCSLIWGAGSVAQTCIFRFMP